MIPCRTSSSLSTSNAANLAGSTPCRLRICTLAREKPQRGASGVPFMNSTTGAVRSTPSIMQRVSVLSGRDDASRCRSTALNWACGGGGVRANVRPVFARSGLRILGGGGGEERGEERGQERRGEERRGEERRGEERRGEERRGGMVRGAVAKRTGIVMSFACRSSRLVFAGDAVNLFVGLRGYAAVATGWEMNQGRPGGKE